MIVYKTINLINRKWYIGRDSNNNPNYLGGGKLIQRAIKKYGKENFLKYIIDCANDLEDLKKKETYWIQKTNASFDINSYNIKNSGQNGIASEDWTVEMRLEAKARALTLSKKERESRHLKTKKWWNKNQRKIQSNLKKEHFKNPKNIETAKQAKLKSIKEDPTQVERQKQSLLKFYKNEENRHKNSKSRGGLEFIAAKNEHVVWQGYSQRMCAEELRLQQPNINKCLKGVRKTSGGYNFRYL